MKLLWLDLETTGLDPDRDDVIEVAYVVTREDLAEIGGFVFECSPCPSNPPERWPSEVRDMHVKSGLLNESGNFPPRGPRFDSLQAEAVRHLGRLVPFDADLILAGSSVHFDRKFLEQGWPKVEARLHHRHLDVSAVAMACELSGRPLQDPPKAHRAMADVQRSIRLMREFVSRSDRGAR